MAAFAPWFWYFLIYSFLGFVLEVCFARVIRHPKRDRKCRCILPICPVYGLGMLCIAALPDWIAGRFLLLFPSAALLATVAEYTASLFYEHIFGVAFWDYTGFPLQHGGRICLPFSLCWGLLAAVLVRTVQPAVLALSARIPAGWFFPALLLFSADFALTLRILRRTHDTNSLCWYRRLQKSLLKIAN